MIPGEGIVRKFFKEFKEFITRGSVLDLAVGMIIGAAFTAIVSALVNNIFKPLIDWIPIGNMDGLKTMLVARDATGAKVAANSSAVDMAKSVYIDWGAFLMAIINFLLTALVLFVVIKAINQFRAGANELKRYNFTKAERAEMKAKGMNAKQMRAELDRRIAEEEARKKAEEEANKPETTEQLLSQIRDLLKALQPEQAAELLKENQE